jgi:3-hydroxy-9,10-secoandrosta-1,3,5(10)-triene-9,17-dione monooxygenase reductase component
VSGRASRTPAELQRAYRDTIGHFATGVTIVTASGSGGPAGMTTNAVTSLSLDPLLLLVCFEARSRTLAAVRESERFAVNILRAGDEDLAAVFATKRVATEKFERVTGQRPHRGWSAAHGVPIIDRALAWVACELQELRPGGDHVIGIGAVVGMSAGDDADPLVYYRGRYTTIEC